MRELDIAFLGKITASMTHEIKNTFAIILESSGLLSDLLSLDQQGSFPHKEKFQRVLGTINGQVKRGVDITTRLNQFAHSMDEARTSVSVDDLLDRVVFLMQRVARHQSLELKAISPDRDVSLMSDLFRLQLVLSAVIEQLAEVLESGGGIILQAQRADQEVRILLEAQGNKKPGWEGLTEARFPALQEVLEILGARLAISLPPAQEGVTLTISTAG